MLRRTLLGIAGCALAAHLAGGVSAQVTTVAYDGPSTPNLVYGVGSGIEVADDLHLIGGGTLVSFDFTVNGFSTASPGATMTATVKFYPNDWDDTQCPPSGPIATFTVPGLPLNQVVEHTVNVPTTPTPVVLPSDVWIGVTLDSTAGDFTGSVVSTEGTGGVDASAQIGSSHDLFYTTQNLGPMYPDGCAPSSAFSQTGAESNFIVTLRLDFLPVQIDIMPGAFPNSINLGSKGVTQVAIFSTTTLDATQVDPLSVRLEDTVVRVKGNGTPQVNYQDANGDGLSDIVLHMETEGLSLTSGDVNATLTGDLIGGGAILGTDSVRIVP